jgi:8-oxo-dGTP diphosphatase
MSASDYIQQIRAHIGHDLLMLPGVSAMIFDQHGRVLLQRRSDTGDWATVGGAIDPGEEPADALVREILEETGIVVEPLRIIGVYATPVITYPNGDRCIYIITQFLCRPLDGEPEPRVADDESLEVRYFGREELPELRPDQLERVLHAFDADPQAWFAPPTMP